MFPNPQGALPLPPRPSLEHYRKLAKELVKACKSDKISEWAGQWTGRSADQIEEFARRHLSEKCNLTGAQFVIARSHGFASWPRFSKHLEAAARKSTAVSRFEAAADAIVNGDIATLKRLLREEPKLMHATSTREHGATLLHYVSANGVEGYRQKTPQNVVEIAEVLLKAGAEVDATADVYGGGCTALGLAATSVWPEKAGVQEELLQKLLDHGASLDGWIAGNRQSIVLACLANGRPNAAKFLVTRGAWIELAAAAGVGLLGIVKEFLEGAPKDQLQLGLRYACGYGRYDVVDFLLARDVDLAVHGGDGQTPLHWAVIGGHLDIVNLLLRYDPPLEAKNVYGGTVLGQGMWSAAHGGDPDTYIAIFETLIAAGAKVPERHVPVNPRVDAWLAQHGSAAEPKWYWYGEKPRG
jgi:hypothetical protein